MGEKVLKSASPRVRKSVRLIFCELKKQNIKVELVPTAQQVGISSDLFASLNSNPQILTNNQLSTINYQLSTINYQPELKTRNLDRHPDKYQRQKI
jgi:hypothetical protein